MGPAPPPSPPLPSLAQRGGAPEALRKTEKQKPVLISKAKLGCGPLSVTHRRRNCQEPAKCQRCQHRVPVWAGPQGENPSHVPSRGRPALGQLGPEIPWHLSKTPADLCFPAKFRFPCSGAVFLPRARVLVDLNFGVSVGGGKGAGKCFCSSSGVSICCKHSPRACLCRLPSEVSFLSGRTGHAGAGGRPEDSVPSMSQAPPLAAAGGEGRESWPPAQNTQDCPQLRPSGCPEVAGGRPPLPHGDSP